MRAPGKRGGVRAQGSTQLSRVTACSVHGAHTPPAQVAAGGAEPAQSQAGAGAADRQAVGLELRRGILVTCTQVQAQEGACICRRLKTAIDDGCNKGSSSCCCQRPRRARLLVVGRMSPASSGSSSTISGASLPSSSSDASKSSSSSSSAASDKSHSALRMVGCAPLSTHPRRPPVRDARTVLVLVLLLLFCGSRVRA